MRTGIRIAIDAGSVRVGVARSDPHGMMAIPVETLRRGKQDLARIHELVTEHDALEVIVGLPLALDGRKGAAAQSAATYAQEIADMVAPTPVRLVDERLSSVEANRQFTETGKTTRQSRSVVDQAAAVIILEHALDFERRGGQPCGTTVGTG